MTAIMRTTLARTGITRVLTTAMTTTVARKTGLRRKQGPGESLPSWVSTALTLDVPPRKLFPKGWSGSVTIKMATVTR